MAYGLAVIARRLLDGGVTTVRDLGAFGDRALTRDGPLRWG